MEMVLVYVMGIVMTKFLLNLNDFDGDGLSTCDGDCNDVDETIEVTDQDEDGYGDCLMIVMRATLDSPLRYRLCRGWYRSKNL